jgi:hypothetical protein
MEPENWESLKPILNQIGEKFLRAKWAEGFIIDESGIVFTNTPFGRRRLKQLWKILNELDASQIEDQELYFLLLIARIEARRLRWK